MPIQSIKDFINQKLIETKQPFQINWDNLKLASGDKVTLNGGIELTSIKELYALESWFLSLPEMKNTKSLLMRAKWFTVAQKLKDVMGFATISEAVEAIESPTKEIAEDDRYVAFQFSPEFTNLVEFVSKGSEFSDLLKVTLFMVTRHNPNWDISDTIWLRQSTVQDILSFISTEASGGVDEVEVTEETVSNTSVEEAEKKDNTKEA